MSTNNPTGKSVLSIHQAAALWWLFGSSFVIFPVLNSPNLPLGAGRLIWVGICTVTTIIAVVPLLLKLKFFRVWFGWTDALTQVEISHLQNKRLGIYYQAVYESGYVSRLLPYFVRVFLAFSVSVVLDALSQSFSSSSALHAITGTAPVYLLGVIFLMGLSSPLVKILRQNRK